MVECAYVEPLQDGTGTPTAEGAILPWKIIIVMSKWCTLGGVQLVRSKIGKKSVRISVTLDEGEYAELTRLAVGLDLSAAWMIRRAVSEFVARHGGNLESELLLRPVQQNAAGKKKVGERA